MSALAGTIKKQNSRFPLSIYTNHRRFYSLSNLLKVHSSKILKKIIFQKTFSSNSLISLRDLNIQRALQRKAMSDFLLQRNTGILCFKIPEPNPRNNSFLPLVFKKNEAIPGLMSLSIKEHFYIFHHSPLAREYRLEIIKRFCKVLYKALLLSKEDTLYSSISSVLGSLFIPFSIKKKSRDIYDLINDKKEIILDQHFACFLFSQTKISYDILEAYCNAYNIDCKSHKEQKITLQTFIEARIIYLNFTFGGKLVDYPFLHLMLTNPENLTPSFSVVASKESTGQMHADLEGGILLPNKNLFKFYSDVKTYTVNGFERNNLSVFHQHDRGLLQEISNIYSSLNNLVETKFKDNPKLKDLLTVIRNIKNNIELPVEERFSLLHKHLLKILLTPAFSHLRVSLSIGLKHEPYFFKLFNEIFMEITPENDKVNPEIPLQLFPRNYQISQEEHKQLVEEIIDSVFPKDLCEEMKKNLNQVLYNKVYLKD
jgi:hypothetical protein